MFRLRGWSSPSRWRVGLVTARHRGGAHSSRDGRPALVATLALVLGMGCAASAPAQLGTLRVSTDPPLLSQISLNGEIRDSWGLNWVHLLPGDYVVHFSHVEGYSEPADQTVTVRPGEATVVTGKFEQRGSLRVVTSPLVPAQISIDGTPRNNGGIWTDFPAGKHSVCFGPVRGYDPPACQDVDLAPGSSATVTGTYVSNPAATGTTGMALLRVETNPSLPVQISLNGQVADTWGLDWVKLPPGTYTVAFSHVEGYGEPAPETIVLSAGNTAVVTGTYAARGSLHVATNPSVPGTITVDGIPRNDLGMWTDFPTGSHEVCFGDVAGYHTPDCQSVTVNAGSLTTVTGTYR